MKAKPKPKPKRSRKKVLPVTPQSSSTEYKFQIQKYAPIKDGSGVLRLDHNTGFLNLTLGITAGWLIFTKNLSFELKNIPLNPAFLTKSHWKPASINKTVTFYLDETQISLTPTYISETEIRIKIFSPKNDTEGELTLVPNLLSDKNLLSPATLKLVTAIDKSDINIIAQFFEPREHPGGWF